MNIENYQDNGFAVLHNVFSPEEAKKLKESMIEAMNANITQLLPGVVLDKLSKIEKNSNDYWAEIPAVQAIHKLYPDVAKALQKNIILDTLKKVMGTANIKCIQSIFFIKAPGSVGTPWHQDELYLPTRDKSLTAVWISLSETSQENGAVDVIPKSHRTGILYNLDPKDFERKTQKIEEWHTNDAVTLETGIGDVAIFNGYLLHSSGFNLTKNKYRESIVFHVMSAESVFPYRPGDNFNNKRIDPTDFRDFFMVCGKDPYSFKGKEDLYPPYIQKPHNIYSIVK